MEAHATRAIVHAIIGQLIDRLVDPDESESTERAAAIGRKSVRKDLYGIGTAIDTFATRGIIVATAAPLLKKHATILKEAGVDIDLKGIREGPFQQQRIHSVIAGSIKAYDRLQQADLVLDRKCPHCGEPEANLHHIVWECDHCAHLRKPNFDAIYAYMEEVAQNDVRRQQRMVELLKKPCVYNCGVVPETQFFIDGSAPLPSICPQQRKENIPRHRHTETHQNRLERDHEERVLAFTDETARNPDDRRRRRPAWGTYYADDHPWNECGLVAGGMQTVFRAEPTAVSHVVRAATEPTHIACECESVVISRGWHLPRESRRTAQRRPRGPVAGNLRQS